MKAVLTGFLLMITGALCAIEKMDSTEQLRECLDGVGPETLVVWDLDMVLIEPAYAPYRMGAINAHKGAFRSLYGAHTPDEQIVAFVLIAAEEESRLVASDTPQLLDSLHKRGISQMALTGCLTGPLGTCPSIEDRRIVELAKLGIDFTPSAPLGEEIRFEELPSYRNFPAVYKDGILFATGQKAPKGDALIAFLARCPTPFSRIVFIDDRLHHLEDVGEKLSRFYPEIDYRGIHFMGADRPEHPPVSSEAFLAAWQRLLRRAETLCAEEV